MAKKQKTVEELGEDAKRLWGVCEDLYQKAYEAERKAKSASNKYKKARDAAKIAA